MPDIEPFSDDDMDMLQALTETTRQERGSPPLRSLEEAGATRTPTSSKNCDIALTGVEEVFSCRFVGDNLLRSQGQHYSVHAYASKSTIPRGIGRTHTDDSTQQSPCFAAFESAASAMRPSFLMSSIRASARRTDGIPGARRVAIPTRGVTTCSTYYGMTLAGGAMPLLASQDFKRAICGTDKNPASQNGVFSVDHDHYRGCAHGIKEACKVFFMVCGLLCVICNSRVGWYETHHETIEGYVNRRAFDD